MTIVHGDVLAVNEMELLKDFHEVISKLDLKQWTSESPVVVIGNLPFGISTELTMKWMRQIPEHEGLFSFGRVPMYLMFQKEVAEVLLIIKKINK